MILITDDDDVDDDEQLGLIAHAREDVFMQIFIFLIYSRDGYIYLFFYFLLM